MFKYEFTSKSLKDLKKLDRQVQIKIIEKLDEICSHSDIRNYAEHLTDYKIGEFRIRIGDYRVIFDLKEETLTILKIGHRKDIYR